MISLVKYLSANQLRKQYALSLKSDNDFSAYIPKMEKMLKDAKLSEKVETIAKREARGNYTAFNDKAMERLLLKRTDLLGSAMPLFNELVATFYKRMLQSACCFSLCAVCLVVCYFLSF